MKTFYFIRHGEAEINPTADVKPIHVKGANAELTPRGRIQADKIAERIAHLPVESLIASTMLRAQQTAEAISRRTQLEVVSSDLFTECVEPSSLIGRVWNDPETQRQLAAWEKTFQVRGHVEGDGENFDAISLRAERALEYLSTRSAEHIAIVTHGYFLRVLVARMLYGDGIEPHLVEALVRGFRTFNTGVTIAHYDRRDSRAPWWISVWNDHAHLGEA